MARKRADRLRYPLGDRIREAIEDGGHTVTEFARENGIARPLVSRWINDPRHPPSEEGLQRIAQGTGVTLAWLRYGEGFPLGFGEEDPSAIERVWLAESLRISELPLPDLAREFVEVAAAHGKDKDVEYLMRWRGPGMYELREGVIPDYVHPSELRRELLAEAMARYGRLHRTGPSGRHARTIDAAAQSMKRAAELVMLLYHQLPAEGALKEAATMVHLAHELEVILRGPQSTG